MSRIPVLTIGVPAPTRRRRKWTSERRETWLAGLQLVRAVNAWRTIRGQRELHVCAKSASYHEHPVVVPHVMHFRHVPFRTIVNWPQSPQGSPS